MGASSEEETWRFLPRSPSSLTSIETLVLGSWGEDLRSPPLAPFTPLGLRPYSLGGFWGRAGWGVIRGAGWAVGWTLVVVLTLVVGCGGEEGIVRGS